MPSRRRARSTATAIVCKPRVRSRITDARRVARRLDAPAVDPDGERVGRVERQLHLPGARDLELAARQRDGSSAGASARLGPFREGKLARRRRVGRPPGERLLSGQHGLEAVSGDRRLHLGRCLQDLPAAQHAVGPHGIGADLAQLREKPDQVDQLGPGQGRRSGPPA